MPSTFPEAFGMVAAEAAACGVLPLSAAHSGLAEVTATLGRALDRRPAPLLVFERGPEAVEEIADPLIALAALPDRPGGCVGRPGRARRPSLRLGERGGGVIAAAEGRLDELPRA